MMFNSIKNNKFYLWGNILKTYERFKQVLIGYGYVFVIFVLPGNQYFYV